MENRFSKILRTLTVKDLPAWLSSAERRVLKARIKGVRQSALGELTGVTRAAIWQIERRALYKIERDRKKGKC